MARSKQRKRTRRKPAPKKKSGGGGGGGGGPKRAQEAKAIKSMLMGMGILAVLAAFFLMPVGGDTPFNHLLGLFGGDEAAESADGGRGASAPNKPSGVKLNTGRGAKPMEKVTEREQADLDDLIEKAKKK